MNENNWSYDQFMIHNEINFEVYQDYTISLAYDLACLAPYQLLEFGVISISGRKETTVLPVCSTTPLATSVIAVTTASVTASVSQIRPTVPIAPAKLVTAKQVEPKFLIPAVSGSQIRRTTSVTSTQLGQLPAETFIPVGGNSSSYVMVPAQYVTQLQQPTATPGTGTQVLNILPAPSTPNSSTLGSQSAFISLSSNPPNNFRPSSALATHPPAHHSPRTPVDIDNRQRKPCNCTKSQCLKFTEDLTKLAQAKSMPQSHSASASSSIADITARAEILQETLQPNPLFF
ncbi:protein lin-54 [Trichonephila clavipes]|nr:protein lin-54 [Trichonephila clavipes]